MAAASPLSGNVKKQKQKQKHYSGDSYFEKKTVSPSEDQLGPQLETQLSQNKKVGPPLLQSSLDQPLASQGEGKELEPPSGLTSHPPTLS